MSENTNTNAGGAPEGKGLAVGGFVLSLVALIFSSWIAGLAAISLTTGGSGWLMYLWLVISIASVVLSAMGMSKLGKTGGKKGLGVAGLVIGIVAVVWSIILVLGLSAYSSGVNALGDDFRDQLKEEINRELGK